MRARSRIHLGALQSVSEPIAILSIAFNAISAIGVIWSVWTHCKADIGHRAVQDDRLDRLENRVTPLEKR